MTFTSWALNLVSFIHRSQNIFPLLYFIKCVVTDFLPLSNDYNYPEHWCLDCPCNLLCSVSGIFAQSCKWISQHMCKLMRHAAHNFMVSSQTQRICHRWWLRPWSITDVPRYYKVLSNSGHVSLCFCIITSNSSAAAAPINVSPQFTRCHFTRWVITTFQSPCYLPVMPRPSNTVWGVTFCGEFLLF